jgi:hypothetical protein
MNALGAAGSATGGRGSSSAGSANKLGFCGIGLIITSSLRGGDKAAATAAVAA